MSEIKSRSEKLLLSAKAIDRLSISCSEALAEAEVDKKDILRIRLSLEEILELWLNGLGEGAGTTLRTGKRFGKQYFQVRVAGTRMDVETESSEDAFLYNRLLSQAGLALEYSYKNGENCLTAWPPKKRQIGQATLLLLSIFCAAAAGLVVSRLPQAAREGILSLTDPLFDMILGALGMVASPMIFLAICWGIFNIGDLSAIGKVGKKMISGMLLSMFGIGIVADLILMWFFPVSTGGEGGGVSGLLAVYQMILDIVPSDIVTPFQEGNIMQVIFLGVCVGLALLILGERAAAVRSLVEQLNDVVSFLMGALGKTIPVFVFLSIFSLVTSDELSQSAGIVKMFVLGIPTCLLCAFLYLVAMSLRYRISIATLAKKLFPTFLIGLSTSSSAAAFATNLETCEKKLGIPAKTANFAVPLGQVIFMPGALLSFLVISLCMAENYGVSITPVWLVMSVLVSVLVAIAAPPVPGGSVACYTVIFAQLGIPVEAVALAVAVNAVLEFPATAANLTCLQVEAAFVSSRLGMLDEEVLRETGN
ncbi:MAG: dicarboxylate/amino acid:cation symporter [Lachnospiraceae bacterium]|nr:dicarboxylate/amino acid:cation symporter [Lachnospiraceae bacterium]